MPRRLRSGSSALRTTETSCVTPTAARVNLAIRGFGCGRPRILCERNPGLEIPGYAAGFTFFGTNGGGEAYAWDWRPERRSRYVVIPFIVPDPDVAVPCGDTLEEFLAVLHGGIPFGG